MNTPSAHAPDVEELLLLAAEKSYGANEETFPEAAHAVNCLMSLHARRQGSTLQQMAVGTLLLDVGALSEGEEGAENLQIADSKTAPPILSNGVDGYILDTQQLVQLANGVLGVQSSVRDRVTAYVALRLCEHVPQELHEMHVVEQARTALVGPTPLDVLTRVYARRVLALTCDNSDEVFALFRAALDEGHPFEAVRLAEAGHVKMNGAKSMSLLALGVTAAEELGQEAVVRMYGLLFQSLRRRFHTLHHALPDGADLSANPEMRSLIGELGQLVSTFSTQEGCEDLLMFGLAEMALQHSMLGDYEEAVDALARLEGEGERNGGISEGVRGMMQLAQEIIDRIAPQDDDSDTQSDWSPEDRDPPDWNTHN